MSTKADNWFETVQDRWAKVGTSCSVDARRNLRAACQLKDTQSAMQWAAEAARCEAIFAMPTGKVDLGMVWLIGWTGAGVIIGLAQATSLSDSISGCALLGWIGLLGIWAGVRHMVGNKAARREYAQQLDDLKGLL